MQRLAGYIRVYSGFGGAGRPVFVREDMHESFEHLLKSHQSNYFKTSIYRQVVALNADPIKGRKINEVGNFRQLKSGNITMSYYLFNGAVLVQSLTLTSSPQISNFGLYNVSYSSDDNAWLASTRKQVSLDAKSQWKSKNETAHYTAVAGSFESVQDAGRALANHVIKAYQKADYLTSSDAKSPFSLFWIKKGMHKKAETAQSLASLMQQSAANNVPVNWLVHGEAVNTFKKVAEILKTTPLATQQQRNANPAAGKIHSQNVYFSNPRISSEKQLKSLCEESGLNYVGMNTNRRDLRQWSTLKNVCVQLAKIGVVSGATGSLGATTLLDTVTIK